jgi:3-deoxy-7-phosphoheptulonate synthase
MILILHKTTTQQQADKLQQRLQWMNLRSVVTKEDNQLRIAIINGSDHYTDFKQFTALPEVANIIPFNHKMKLASCDYKKQRTIIDIKGTTIGGDEFAIMAGPCSIESEEHIMQTAFMVKQAGANILRGGAFKPRTSPYDFQGLGEKGLMYLQNAAQTHGLISVTEVMDSKDIALVADYSDILQIGARNMQNFSLLREVGKAGKPVLLKRGLSATYMEFLMAAEYILQADNPNVILCERGIRTFEPYARNTLDIAAVPILHELSHLPVIIDPSHGTGIRKIVPAMAYAAIAAGADGLMVEVHPQPDKALSDAQQTISPATLSEMIKIMRQIGKAVKINVRE